MKNKYMHFQQPDGVDVFVKINLLGDCVFGQPIKKIDNFDLRKLALISDRAVAKLYECTEERFQEVCDDT